MTGIHDEARAIQRDSNTPAAYVGESLLMMSVEEGRYFSLNEAGARIWELLATPVTQPAIVEKLMGEYDVSPEVCSAQVKDFINALSARHLISEAGQNTTQCG